MAINGREERQLKIRKLNAHLCNDVLFSNLKYKRGCSVNSTCPHSKSKTFWIALLVVITAFLTGFVVSDTSVEADQTLEPTPGIKYKIGQDYDGNDCAVVYGCRSLNVKDVVIPAYVEIDGKTYPVKQIEDYAFGSDPASHANKAIETLVLPETMEMIGKGAFTNTNLSGTLTIPESVLFMGKICFENCPLEKVIIKAKLTEQIKTINITDTEDHNNSMWFKGCKNLKEAIFYGETIPRSCFGECTKLEKVTLNGVKYTGYYAFNGCISLQIISFPDSLSNDTDVCIPTIFNESSRPSDCMFKFYTGDTEIAVSTENMKGKVWQRVENSNTFKQVTKLTLDANGGGLTCDAEQYIPVGSGFSITDPLRADYTFGGWDPALPAKMPSTDLSCKAVWLVSVPAKVI